MGNQKGIGPEEGNKYNPRGGMIVKVTSDDTDGTYEVCEENCPPGFESTAHFHSENHETFYIVSGSCTWTIGDETYHCVPGSTVHMPPGVPHKVVSEEGVKMLMIYGPAGTEAMFADMNKLTPEQRADKDYVAEVRGRHKTVNIE